VNVQILKRLKICARTCALEKIVARMTKLGGAKNKSQKVTNGRTGKGGAFRKNAGLKEETLANWGKQKEERGGSQKGGQKPKFLFAERTVAVQRVKKTKKQHLRSKRTKLSSQEI